MDIDFQQVSGVLIDGGQLLDAVHHPNFDFGQAKIGAEIPISDSVHARHRGPAQVEWNTIRFLVVECSLYTFS